MKLSLSTRTEANQKKATETENSMQILLKLSMIVNFLILEILVKVTHIHTTNLKLHKRPFK